MIRKVLYFPREGNGLNHLAVFDNGEEFKTSNEGFAAYISFRDAGFDNFELARNAYEARKKLVETQGKPRIIFSHPTINFSDIEPDLERAFDFNTYLILFSGHDELTRPLGRYHPEINNGLHRIVRASDIFTSDKLRKFIKEIISKRA